MQKLILGIIGSIFLFVGCANKDLANHYLNEGKLKKAYKIYEKWDKIDNVKATYKLEKLETNEERKIHLAEKMYYHGIKYGANILENIYFNKGDLKQAIFWYERADLNNSKQKDFYTHLNIILTFPTITEQKKELKKIENIADKNIYAAHALGKFYENKSNYFYDINKSVYFYKKAYEQDYIPSGINLAKIYLYNLNKEKEGEKLLRKIASEDPRAAYILAKYLVNKLNEKIIKLNTPCITCNFKTPYEFFYKKYYLITYKDLYIKKKIIPLINYAYKKGYIKAKFLLIELDLKYDNFLTNNTYSGFTLNEAISFLNNLSDKFFKAKMLLADIYYKYDFLNMYPLAKNIYLEYANINKIDAYWHLYQYYKKYEPYSPKKIYYLKFLVEKNFIPAIIEYAYLKKDIKTLYYFSKRVENNKNNILALKYYISLMENKIKNYAEKCSLYNKLCIYTPFDKTTDFKIAKLYESNKNIVKAATIYKFYSDMNDSLASYKLSLIYKNLCAFDKYIFYLKKAKQSTNEKIKFWYAAEVIKGYINDNQNKSLKFIKYLADKNNTVAICFLAKIYAKGIYVDFNPNIAEKYYLKAIDLGKYKCIYSLINLYKIINLNHEYDNKIINLYRLAVKYNLPKANINLAEFYIALGKYKKAKEILKNEVNDPKARYLLYNLTGKEYYLKNVSKTNYGGLLLIYAKKIGKYNPYRALLYSFRAARCNTGGAVIFSYEMMKRINNPKIIRKIYKKAKKYPKCENY